MKKILFMLSVLIMITGFTACTDSANQTVQTTRTDDEIIADNPTTVDPSAPTELDASTEPTEPVTDIEDTEADAATQVKKISFSGVTFEMAEEGVNYELYRHTGRFATYYRIYDNRGIILDVGFDTNNIEITQDGNIVQASYNGGMCCHLIKYYDVEVGRASAMIENPLAVNDDLVAITSSVGRDMCLIVKHIFDPKAYYKAFVLDPKPDNPVQFEAVFTDAQHIQLTYSTAEGMVTKTFSIDDPTENQVPKTGDGSVKYPVLHNGNYDYSVPNKTIENILNQKVAYLLEDTSEIVTFSTDYSIMLQSTEHISILYKLYANMKDTAHPINVEFGINMDATGLPENFQDVIAVDQEFVSRFRTAWNEQCGEDLQNYLDRYTDEELLELFQGVDPVSSDISFYLTEEGISIIFPVPRAIGSFVHIKLATEQ